MKKASDISAKWPNEEYFHRALYFLVEYMNYQDQNPYQKDFGHLRSYTKQ